MNTLTDLIDRYIATWNETDAGTAPRPDRRRPGRRARAISIRCCKATAAMASTR